MTLSVFNAEVNGPNTLSSLENSFLNLVSLGKSPLVILINGKLLSSFKRILYLGENFLISNGDRIAQMILTPVLKMELEEVNNLPESIRGKSGFGSTGK